MTEAVGRLATYQDLLALSEDERAEIVDGAMVTAPAPLPRHSKAQGAIRRFIGGPFDDDDGRGGPGGWWIFVEVDIQLGDHDIVRPDLTGWKRARLPEPWDLRPIATVPDWICEVISPSNAAYDRVTKAQLYANHGVPYFWLADPTERTLESFRLSGAVWTRIGSYDERATARIEPFEEVELEVKTLFPPTTK